MGIREINPYIYLVTQRLCYLRIQLASDESYTRIKKYFSMKKLAYLSLKYRIISA